ncbi:hypothetical protein Pint_23842 [Pistacia integerrima]|uniref:Uncharacterized protein n=1 Tax=Pistacia integerrima TaxID=434235 RepID=A0ACC0YLF1_9ROSI|nr:hypothetical protein Pint_23842 [Pistacia integerrima]
MSSNSSSSEVDDNDIQFVSQRFQLQDVEVCVPCKTFSGFQSYRSLAVLSGHVGSVSCLALCGEFILSASQGKDIIVWQQPDLRLFTKFGEGDGSIKALVTVGNKVFTAHQDSRIRVWKVSRRSETDGKIKAWGKEGKSSHSLKGILEGHKDVSLNSVVVSEDGKWVYGAGSDGFVMGWEGSADFVSWKLICETKAHEMAVLCVCLAGELFCSGSADKSIGIWKREAYGKLCKVGIINGHEGPVKCLQASPNSIGGGFLLYSGGLDKSVRVWWVPKHSPEKQDNSTEPNYTEEKSTILC